MTAARDAARDRPLSPASAVHSRPAALALLVVLALIWGVHWVVVKEGLRYFPPLTYASLRLATALLTMLAILAPGAHLHRPSREDGPIILSVALLQMAAGVLIMNFALQAVPAGRSSVLVYTMPLWVALLLWLRFRAAPRRNELLGLALGVVGIVILVNPSVIDWAVPAELAGTLALVGNGVLWAIVTIHIRRHHWRSSPLELQPWMLLVALLPVLAATLAIEPGRAIRWEPASVAALLYSGPLATAFAFWASQSITRALGPISSAMGFLATPVVGLLAGALLLHEQLGLADLAGFGLVLVGIGATTLLPAARSGATREATPEPV